MRKFNKKTIWLTVLVLVPILIMCFATFVLVITKLSSPHVTASYGTLSGCNALAKRLNADNSYSYNLEDIIVPSKGGTTQDSADNETLPAGGYSQTNVQVAGIDEADVIKTDGEYIYVIKGYAVYVIDARDPTLADYVAELSFDDQPTSLFVSDNKLVVLTSGYHFYDFPETSSAVTPDYWRGNRDKVVMSVYDTKDIAEPELESTTSFDGSMQTARLKDDVVYIVANYSPYYYGEITATEAEALLPQMMYKSSDDSDATYVPMAPCEQVAYYGDKGTNFTAVVSLDLAETDVDKALLEPKVLVGNTESLYMSHNNIYLTTSRYEDEVTPLCDGLQEALGICSPDTESNATQEVQTEIFRIAIADGGVEFAASGLVPGRILNQFSMDEDSGYFRIATTRTELYGTATINNVYVLDESLEVVGSLEGLAEGENIYSVRFLDDRAYVVTFRQTDPLFVVDLSQPTEPKLLGELKIPGFSDYLHPYDDTHLIGFGKAASSSGVTSGLKVALFDVSSPTEPKEINKLELGARGSDSELLTDHKALLFDREKNLMVFPLSLYDDPIGGDWYGELTFEGFGVFSIDLTNGIIQRGLLENVEAGNYYYYSVGDRALYVGDNLFVSEGDYLKAYKLADLTALGSILLGE